jgi:hypothetical protein
MGQQVNRLSIAVSATNASGVCTVASTSAIWNSQIGWISKSGVTSQRIQVVEILSATTFRARILPRITDDNFAKGSNAAYPSNQFSDLSAFNGSANFDAEPQVVPGNAVVTVTSATQGDAS